MTPQELVGAWSLVDFVVRYDDGRPLVRPFGEGALGSLIYAATGQMSAVLSRAGREPLSTGSLESSGRARVDEKAVAFDSYLSYAGEWRIEGNHVVHVVALGLVPNIVGQENWRVAKLVNHQLLLCYQLTPASGVTRTFELIWRRP
jgi:hypothetical protein